MLSVAGINTTISPVNAPVNSMFLLADSVVELTFQVVRVIIDDPATDLDM